MVKRQGRYYTIRVVFGRGLNYSGPLYHTPLDPPAVPDNPSSERSVPSIVRIIL